MTLNQNLEDRNRQIDDKTKHLNDRIQALADAIKQEKEQTIPEVPIPEKEPLVTTEENQNQEPSSGA